jgi:hypothetical protein
MLVVSVAPAFASSSRPTISEPHRILGVNIATNYQAPYWQWDGKKLLATHSGTMWTWTNIIASATEYAPYWMSYPTGKKSYGVYWSKAKFALGITAYGLPLGYTWTCQLASHCYYNGSVMYGETCSTTKLK